MIRNEVENPLFNMKFLNKMSPEFKGRLSDYSYYKKNKYEYKQDLDMFNYYLGEVKKFFNN